MRASELLSYLMPSGAGWAFNIMQHLKLAAADGGHASQVTEEDLSAAVAAIAATRQAAYERLQQLRADVDQQQLVVQQAHALGTLRCAHLGCTNLAGANEEQVQSRLCSHCRAVRFCSEACSQATWRQHKAACKAIKRERQAQG
jgi:hypothetical protein